MFKIKGKKTIKKTLVFNDEDEAETSSNQDFLKTVNKQIQESNKRSSLEALEHQKRALAEDESIFDYDGSYDQIKCAEEAAKLQRSKVSDTREAKYIHHMMKQAFERSKEKERFIERKVKKEIEKELEGVDKEDIQVFVTDAYRIKQEEMKKLEEEERRLQEAAAKTDSKNYAGFYRNLIDARSSIHENIQTQLQNVVEKGEVVERVEKTEPVLKRDADGQEILKGGLNVLRKITPKTVQLSSVKPDGYKQIQLTKEIPNKEAERERLSQMFEQQLKQVIKVDAEKEEIEKESTEAKFIRKTTEDAVLEAKKRAEERRKARLQSKNTQ